MHGVSTQPAASAPIKARPKGGQEETGKYYNASFRIPRPTMNKVADHLRIHDLSLQGILAEAFDAWLRANNVGTFLPEGEGWEGDPHPKKRRTYGTE